MKKHTDKIANTQVNKNDCIKRDGWEKAFKEMAENGDDELLILDVFADEVIPDYSWSNDR